MNSNLDMCGIVLMLRQLVQKGTITLQEGQKIASKIAYEKGATIILSV